MDLLVAVLKYGFVLLLVAEAGVVSWALVRLAHGRGREQAVED